MLNKKEQRLRRSRQTRRFRRRRERPARAYPTRVRGTHPFVTAVHRVERVDHPLEGRFVQLDHARDGSRARA